MKRMPSFSVHKCLGTLSLLGTTFLLWGIWSDRAPGAFVLEVLPGPAPFCDKSAPINRTVVIVKPKRVFTNGQARPIVHININRTLSHASAKNKIIFLATAFHGMMSPDHFYALQLGRESFENYKCSYANCLVTRDQTMMNKADAVLFHMRDLAISRWPDTRSAHQKWILYTMEPPWLDFIDIGKLDGYFNWTMSYRKDSDIVVPYGLIAARQKPSPPGIKKPDHQRPKKDKFAVWFVSDCCTESRREQFVTELRQHIPVDVFGGCGKPPCQPAEAKTCYDQLNGYRFYLSFENAICKDYVTEKFFNILEQDVVPIVFGGANYSSLAPPGSYIDALSFKSPRHLADYLKTVASDDDLYWKFFDWKLEYRAYLVAWPCDVCAKLNTEAEVRTVRTRLGKWWNQDALCRSWTPHGLRTGLNPVIPCFRRQIFT